MSQFKKLAAAAFAVSTMAATMPASAIVVGGIDFGALGALSHIETATVASTFAPSVGDLSTSYGLVTSVNGDTTYCADGSASCSLYFIATSTVTSVAGPLFHLGSTAITVYYSGSAGVNLLLQDSLANLAIIGALAPWATLVGEIGVDPSAAGLVSDTFGILSLAGASVSFLGTGLLSVDTSDGSGLASVEAFLDANTIPTFAGSFADIAFSESTNNLVLNPFDTAGPLADKCGPVFEKGDWCLAGTLDLRGNTVVPTPGSLALLGLGLFGIGATRRLISTK